MNSADVMAGAPRPVRPGGIAIAWQSLRPGSLTVAVLPVLVGTAAAFASGGARPLVAIACGLTAVLLQAGTNVLNDAEDALTGADDHPAAGSSVAMRQGWITPMGARGLAATCLGAAGVVGVTTALAAHRPALLALGVVGLLVAWAYTAPPLRLAYRPLGELASGLPMGIGITWGTAAAQLDHVPATVWWASLPLALLIAAILHANNARDRDHDAAVGKRTLATYLSRSAVVVEYRLLLAAGPLCVLAGVLLRQLPWTCLLALVPGALCLRTAASASGSTDATGWTRLLGATVGLLLLTGLALAAGLTASRWVH